MSGFDYGNARVRARKAGLLVREDYEALLDRSVEEVLGLLTRTAYAPDVDHALTRFEGLRALHEAVRVREAREVVAVQGFFAGDGARATALWASRYDLANLVTVLRGVARGADPDEIIAHLVPTGIEGGVLADLARQGSVRAVLDRMVVWSLPSRRVARAVAEVWSSKGIETEPAEIELALLRAWAIETDAALEEGLGGPVLARILRDDCDARNLVTALRLHDGGAPVSAELLGEQWLPCGRMRRDRVADAVAHADRAEVVRELPATPWGTALEAWASGATTVATTSTIHRAQRAAIHLQFAGGDPLGIGVPVAYLSALQVEARNLRAIGRAAVHAIPAELVRSQLVVLEAA